MADQGTQIGFERIGLVRWVDLVAGDADRERGGVLAALFRVGKRRLGPAVEGAGLGAGALGLGDISFERVELAYDRRAVPVEDGDERGEEGARRVLARRVGVG